MDKRTIIKYLNKQLPSAEVEELFCWIEASEENRSYFNTLKNLWTAGGLSKAPYEKPDFSLLKRKLTRLDDERMKRKLVLMRNILRVAASLLIPLAVGVTWLLYDKVSVIPLAQADNPMVRIYTPFCTKAELLLPDSTKVWLNAGSSLSYPRRFEGNKRQVKLEGEAYFDVYENKSFPFVVYTPNDMAINVTGTSFNVRAYADDNEAEMTLVEGSIALQRKGLKEIAMKPGQSIRYEKKENKLYIKSDVDLNLYTSWIDGVLHFDNTSMEDIAKRLERWYGVNVHVENESVLTHRYSGKFKEESLIQILELIQQTSNIRYRMEEKNVFLFIE